MSEIFQALLASLGSGLFQTLLTALGSAISLILVAWLNARVRSGRLGRTLDRSASILDFVNQCSTRYSDLTKLPDACRSSLERLILGVVEAVQEDFLAERAILSATERGTRSDGSLFFPGFPRSPILYVPLILYYTTVLFIVYLCIVRVYQLSWSFVDTLVLVASALLGILFRWLLASKPAGGGVL